MQNISNEFQRRNREEATGKNKQRIVRNPELQKSYLEDVKPLATASRMKNRLIQKSTAKKQTTNRDSA